MVRVKIKHTVPVAPDGIHIVRYMQDEEYEVSEEIAKILVVDLKAAGYVVEKKKIEEVVAVKEEKMVDEEYDNKSVFAKKRK